MSKPKEYDIIIVGAGLAGLTCAFVLVRMGYNTALVSPETKTADGRSTAFLKHSVDFLKTNDIWREIENSAAPMSIMRIIDDTDRILRSPEMAFRSAEIGEEVFGYNILNAEYCALLQEHLNSEKKFTRITDAIKSLEESDNNINITTINGMTLRGNLLIGADGKNSTCRNLANDGKGIAAKKWTYPQQAIVLNFKHTLPHHDASNEFHRNCGPFTQVPLSKDHSSLVWVETPENASHILKYDVKEQQNQIEQRLHSILGKVEITSKPQSFPLSGLKAENFALGRVFLVGDAGHCMPPIGAQGFNLGIRDIECLQNLLSKHSLDEPGLADKYHHARKNDITSRLRGVDLLNRSLLSEFLPTQLARTATMQFINSFPPLRQLAIHEGLSPGFGVRKIFKKRVA